MSEQMCVSCGENPAEDPSSTVPLCSGCKALASGKERGVTMAPKPILPKKAKGKLAAAR